MEQEPLVSVLVQTFNQKDYIGQCLEGIIHQDCPFAFEILVHDDASTDGTGDVVREYAARYPDLIKAIIQTENQYYKPNVNICKNFQYPRAAGRYIAMCEGDDYWIDNGKLARQVSYMEAHSDCSLLAENGYWLYVDSGRQEIFSNEPERDFTIDEMLFERRFPTASVLFRKADVQAIYDLKKGCFDTAMWCALAKRGRVHFLPNISSVYRRGCGVTGGNPIKWAKQVLKFDEIIEANFTPSKVVRKERHRGIFWALYRAAQESMKNHKYKDFINYLTKAICYSPSTFGKEILKKFHLAK